MAQRSLGKRGRKGRYMMLAAIGFVGLVVVLLGYGLYSQRGRERPPETIALTIAQERVYARALGEYFCPCGACTERFIDCHCPTALRVKKDTRRRLQQEGASYEDIVWLLENTYKAKKKAS